MSCWIELSPDFRLACRRIPAMVGLFMNFSRLTDKALREYDAARSELLFLYRRTTGRALTPICAPSTLGRIAPA
jgi:hypothetical protein